MLRRGMQRKKVVRMEIACGVGKGYRDPLEVCGLEKFQRRLEACCSLLPDCKAEAELGKKSRKGAVEKCKIVEIMGAG